MSNPEAPNFESLTQQCIDLKKLLLEEYGQPIKSGLLVPQVTIHKNDGLEPNLVSVGITSDNIRLAYTNGFQRDDYVDFRFIKGGRVVMTERKEEPPKKIKINGVERTLDKPIPVVKITEDVSVIGKLLNALNGVQRILAARPKE